MHKLSLSAPALPASDPSSAAADVELPSSAAIAPPAPASDPPTAAGGGAAAPVAVAEEQSGTGYTVAPPPPRQARVGFLRGAAPMCFALSRSLEAEMARFEELMREQPQRVAAMMRTGRQLETLAAQGDLMQIGAMLSFAQEGDLLPWFNVKMFKAACAANHREVMRFMVERGFDLLQSGVESLHTLVAGWSKASGDGEEGEGVRALEATARWLMAEGVDVNMMRRGDQWSALHVSAALQSIEATRVLLALGADANCVAHADVMPLHCAQGGEAGAADAAAEADAQAKAEAQAKADAKADAKATFAAGSTAPASAPGAEEEKGEKALSVKEELVALLLAHGARRTWRLRAYPAAQKAGKKMASFSFNTATDPLMAMTAAAADESESSGGFTFGTEM